MNILIWVNVIGGIAMTIFALSALLKNKKKILGAQSIAHILLIVSEALNQTYSSIVQEVISIIRNVCIIFNKNSKWLMISLVFIATVLGVVFNIFLDNNSWIGYLPIIANLEFGIVVILPNINEKYLKLSLFVSNVLWAIFFIITKNYLSGGFNAFTSILSLISLFTYKNDKKKELND